MTTLRRLIDDMQEMLDKHGDLNVVMDVYLIKDYLTINSWQVVELESGERIFTIKDIWDVKGRLTLVK